MRDHDSELARVQVEQEIRQRVMDDERDRVVTYLRDVLAGNHLHARDTFVHAARQIEQNAHRIGGVPAPSPDLSARREAVVETKCIETYTQAVVEAARAFVKRERVDRAYLRAVTLLVYGNETQDDALAAKRLAQIALEDALARLDPP